jgi:hypothetical protein
MFSNFLENIDFLRKQEITKHIGEIQNNDYYCRCISKGGQKWGQKKRAELLSVCCRSLVKQNELTAYT